MGLLNRTEQDIGKFILASLFFFAGWFVMQNSCAEGQYVNVLVPNYRLGGFDRFKIPVQFRPEVHGDFFKIVVDYPSMNPTSGARVPPLTKSAIDIEISPFPRNATIGEEVLRGTYGAKPRGTHQGYAVYDHPLGASGLPQALLFNDPDGNHVVVELLGDWAVRNDVEHDVFPRYHMRYSLNKTPSTNYMAVDARVAQLISGMYVGHKKN